MDPLQEIILLKRNFIGLMDNFKGLEKKQAVDIELIETLKRQIQELNTRNNELQEQIVQIRIKLIGTGATQK